MNDDGFFPGVILGALVALALMGVAMCSLSASWKDEAVDKGYAEYYLDASHVRQWHWKNGK